MENFTLVRPKGCDFELEVPSRNLKWYLDGYERYTSTIFSQLCLKSKIVVDIGAHVGYYTLLAKQKNPDSRVIALEASPINVRILRQNIIRNKCRVEVIDKVFHQQRGYVDFHLTEASDNSSIGGNPNSPTVEVLSIGTIGESDLSLNLEESILIKIDIEGFECSALDALANTIENCTNIKIIIEMNPNCLSQQGSDPKILLEKLKNFGFRVFSIADEDLSWREVKGSNLNALLNLNGMGYMNLVCLKASSTSTFSGVLHSGGLYGGERAYLELASSLVSDGNMVHSVIPLPDFGLAEELLNCGSSVSFVKNSKWWVNSKLNLEDLSPEIWSQYIDTELISALKAVDSDFILSSSIVFPQGAVGASILEKPHLWWIQEFGDLDHGFELPLNPPALGKFVKNLSSGVVTVSQSVKNYFFESEDDFVRVIYPQPETGIKDFFATKMNPGVRLAVLGSFQKGKGHEDAIRAVSLLIYSGINLELTFYGDGSHEDKNRLLELANDLDITEHVFIEKFKAERKEIYTNINIALITSRKEAYGRVPGEATAYNVPVIYANSGGPSEYMIDGKTGLAYEPGNFKELSQKISAILEDSEIAFDLVLNAKNRFKELRELGSVGFQFKQLLLSNKLESQDSIYSESIRHAFAILERDSAILERYLVLNSKTWKITRIYRLTKEFMTRK